MNKLSRASSLLLVTAAMTSNSVFTDCYTGRDSDKSKKKARKKYYTADSPEVKRMSSK